MIKRLLPLIILFAGALSCGVSKQIDSTSGAKAEKDLSVGYGTVDRNANAFSVSSIEMSQAEETIYNDMYDYLRNKVPGVVVSETGGVGSIPKITVRGEKTIGLGEESNPLFYIDDKMVGDLNVIMPNEVHSVNVLKGAAASAYGSRSANGVILVKTKFAHERELREAEEKKAAKEQKKQDRKNKNK